MARLDFIRRLIKEKPEHYLRTVQIKLDNKIYYIGLFECSICGKPITDKQFNYARCCGSCDTGQDNPDWVIEKPEPQEFEEQTVVDDIDLEDIPPNHQ